MSAHGFRDHVSACSRRRNMRNQLVIESHSGATTSIYCLHSLRIRRCIRGPDTGFTSTSAPSSTFSTERPVHASHLEARTRRARCRRRPRPRSDRLR
ncbi:hypothetical protein RHCRD62_40323 [Rhodococcus sp. RD6.2]|nr:hypothetical protein RHCRD62_40323 [Rhodococcus sp. RD6.2]